MRYLAHHLPVRLLLGGLATLLLLLIGSCTTPTSLGLDVHEVLTRQPWEVVEVEFTFDYHVTEEFFYTDNNDGKERFLSQRGRLQVLYDQEVGNWEVTNQYTRSETNEQGFIDFPEERETVELRDLYLTWNFGEEEITQEVQEQGIHCFSVFQYQEMWRVLEGIFDQPANDVIGVGFCPLAFEDFAGEGMRYHEAIQLGPADEAFDLWLQAKVFYDGKEVILRHPTEHDPEWTTGNSVTEPDGFRMISERSRDYYFEIRLRPQREGGCQVEPYRCTPHEVPCVNGTLYDNGVDYCVCQCDPGWGGPACNQAQDSVQVRTLAGNSRDATYRDGIGSNAGFCGPGSLTLDEQGAVYVVDTYCGAIRRIDTATQTVTTFAGDGQGSSGYRDGVAGQALFNYPGGLAYHAQRRTFYVADTDNRVIRTIGPEGMVSTLAGVPGRSGYVDGPADVAEFAEPTGLWLDPGVLRGHPVLLIADQRVIRLLDLQTLEVSTYAGQYDAGGGYRNGPGDQALLGRPQALTLSSEGILYFSDRQNYVVRGVRPGPTREVFTFVGQDPNGQRLGLAPDRPRFDPGYLAIGPSDRVYVADHGMQVISAFAEVDGQVTEIPIAGDRVAAFAGYQDGPVNQALFRFPRGMTVLPNGEIFLSDQGNGVIRHIGP